MRPSRYLSLALSAMLLYSLVPRSARADAGRCIENNERGSASRARGELSAARAAYLQCAEDSCPQVIRDECQRLVSDIDAAMPTVVLAAKDARGADVLGVRVFVDGREHSPGVDGRPLALDPGEHAFRFVTAEQARELRAVVREGEKNRPLGVELPSQEPHGRQSETSAAPGPRAASPAEVRPVPPLAYALASTGLAALGSFTYFALRGRAQQSDLESRCAPGCPLEDARSMSRNYLAADISLALAALSLGGATYVFVTRPPALPSTSTARAPVTLPDGIALQLAGQF